MKKLLLAFALSIALTGSVTAVQPEQSHNLSEIHPIDEDFNMSDRYIFNLSSLRLNDGSGGKGLFLDDHSIRDSGGNYYLTLDSSNAEWDITGADLNLNSNNIDNFFGSACTGDKVVTKVNSDGTYQCTDVDTLSSTQDLNTTLTAGNLANQSIYMTGNNIEGINALDLDSTGDIRVDGSDAIRLDASQNVEIPKGSLDVSSSRITVGPSGTSNVAELNSTSGAGTRMLIDNSNNDAQQFGLITGRTANELSISRFDEDGNFQSNGKALAIDTSSNVEIPNGQLRVLNGNGLKTKGSTASMAIERDVSDGSQTPTEEWHNSGSREWITTYDPGSSGEIMFRENTEGSFQTLFQMNAGGPVEVKNADLDLNQNQANNFVLDKRASDPSSPVNGQMWYRTDLD